MNAQKLPAGQITSRMELDEALAELVDYSIHGRGTTVMATTARSHPPVCDILQDPTIPDRVFCESRKYRAAVSWGALVPGHTIIFPVDSYRSIGDAIDYSDYYREFQEFVKDVSARIQAAYKSKDVLMCEHGNASFRQSLRCGTEHAHLHLVPVADACFDSVISTSYNWTRHDGLDVLRVLARERREYLFYSDTNGTIATSIESDRRAPEQFFRRIVASRLGISNWDWKKFPNAEMVEESVRRLRNRSGAGR